MKRVFSSSSSSSTVALQFILLPEERITPRDLDDFDSYYHGTVLVHACAARPQLVGTRLSLKVHNLISTTPYYVYSCCSGAQINLDSKGIEIDKDAPPCQAKCLKPGMWNRYDVAHLAEELCNSAGPWSWYVERVLAGVRSVHGTRLAACVKRLDPTVGGIMAIERTDLVRLPYASVLIPYVVGFKNPKRKRAWNALSMEQIQSLHRTFCDEPWELVWRNPMHNTYHLKPMKRTQYLRMVRELGGDRAPFHVQMALRIYFDMMGQRHEDKHTLFARSHYKTVVPCVANRAEVEAQAYKYLFSREVVQVDDLNIALKDDYDDAISCIAALERVRTNSLTMPEPVLRGTVVPQLPPTLTCRQAEIATHIQHNDVTLVEGLPGTGKTALITWVYSHYARVMMVSFVGAMVRSLRERNGNRPEAAYTIHHLLYVLEHNEVAQEWLNWFEVLVVDEFSNLSMRLFTKLMRAMPRLRKLVFVGDHRQLPPIKWGAPMIDLLRRYGSHVLHDNLRVVPELRALQEAPALIAQGRASEIRFVSGPQGPLTLVDRIRDTQQMLRDIISSIQPHGAGSTSLMDTHIVVLLNKGNDGLHYINRVVMETYEAMGRLRLPPHTAPVYVRHGLSLYVGCKITVLSNYNKPIESDDENGMCQSDPVCNGELFIITRIDKCQRPARGIRIECRDGRVLWIESKRGIHPSHIEHGYATTTYKSQGKNPMYHDPMYYDTMQDVSFLT